MTASFKLAALSALLLLSACAESGSDRESGLALPPPPAIKLTGLAQVMGHTATGLTSLFGKPDLDLRELNGRRLQFRGTICVLDAYLYPPIAGREAVTTYVEARLPDGRDTDRAACVSALTRGRGR